MGKLITLITLFLIPGSFILAQQKTYSAPAKNVKSASTQQAENKSNKYLSPFYERRASRYSDGDVSYVNSEVVFELDAEDSKTGLHHVEFAIDREKFRIYEEPFRLEEEGNRLIQYRAIDNSGNIEKTVLYQVFVDNTPPVTEIGTDRGVFEKNGYLYCSKRLKFYISAQDREPGSGIRSTYAGISIDQMAPRGTGISSEKNFFSVADGIEGVYEFYYTAIDNVGNLAEIKKYNVIVDNTPPLIEIDKDHWINVPAAAMKRNKNLQINEKAILIIPDKDKKNGYYVNGNYQIAFKGIDPKIGVFDGSGVATIYIKVNDENFVQYKGPIKFQKADSYQISVKAEDNVGNISEVREYYFWLDFDRPKSNLKFKDASGRTLNERERNL
ncbi:MAG: hypothetical protein OEZ22_07665 [Spirochaetia bacterium]|nr:hypothetical protein [Spirochaetia bacterium]